MYYRLIDASRNIDYSLLNEMASAENISLTGAFETPILKNKNDILVILHLIAGMTGKNIDLEFLEELPPTKEKKKRVISIPKQEDLPEKTPKNKATKKVEKKVTPKKVTNRKSKDVSNFF